MFREEMLLDNMPMNNLEDTKNMDMVMDTKMFMEKNMKNLFSLKKKKLGDTFPPWKDIKIMNITWNID